MEITLRVIPDRIAQGGKVILKAETTHPPDSGYMYAFTWRLDSKKQEWKSPEVELPTADLEPGAHKVEVEAKPAEKAAQSESGTAYLIIEHKPLTTADVQELTAGVRGNLETNYAPLTQDFVDNLTTRVKKNLDDKLDKLAGSVEDVAQRMPPPGQPIAARVNLQRTAVPSTPDQALWAAIRNRTRAIGFKHYHDFIDRVLCQETQPVPQNPAIERQLNERVVVDNPHFKPPVPTTIVGGVGAYELLKTATETFLLLNAGVVIDKLSPEELADEQGRLGEAIPLEELSRRLNSYLGLGQLPYIERVVQAAFPGLKSKDSVYCDEVLITSRVAMPCLLELIWSYWHEEGMLVQTLNAISLRFQNRQNGNGRDPLAHLEIDPIRPLNNLLWGHIQDEQHRLTVQRRAYEYDHHYGMTLYGKAVPRLRSVDSRSKFIEAFHNLLHLTAVFYTEADDTTRVADAFPVLNALKETHLVLAQGAHNQFGDLPWTARAEMLIQQWLLARREMRDFLQSRPMVPYPEGWMAQVDTMKKVQGWSDTTVSNFHDLAVFGEQILLSIRYGDWIDVTDPAQAANWANNWRPEIQSYAHAYRAVTGVDLTARVTSEQALSLRTTSPSELLRQRLEGGSVPMMPAPASMAPQGFRARRATPRS